MSWGKATKLCFVSKSTAAFINTAKLVCNYSLVLHFASMTLHADLCTRDYTCTQTVIPTEQQQFACDAVGIGGEKKPVPENKLANIQDHHP